MVTVLVTVVVTLVVTVVVTTDDSGVTVLTLTVRVGTEFVEGEDDLMLFDVATAIGILTSSGCECCQGWPGLAGLADSAGLAYLA
jgi:hypothetical protein